MFARSLLSASPRKPAVTITHIPTIMYNDQRAQSRALDGVCGLPTRSWATVNRRLQAIKQITVNRKIAE